MTGSPNSPCRVIDVGILEFARCWELQRTLFDQRLRKEIPDTLLLVQHPHTYTIGKTGSQSHLLLNQKALDDRKIALFEIDRGGDITYHGPGQIVGYPILDLNDGYRDVHRYLRDLEETIIRTLSDFGVAAGRQDGLTGVWIEDRKICAIGVKVTRWITMHGFAFNVNPDLSFFGDIVPCGITDKSVTSLAKETGQPTSTERVVERLLLHFGDVFRRRMVKQEVATPESVS